MSVRESLQEDYAEFIEYVKKTTILSTVNGILEWDQNVTMRPGEGPFRAKQKGVLSAVVHELSTSERLGNLLGRLRDAEGLTAEQARNVSLVARSYERSVNVPARLAQELSETRSHAMSAWGKAKEENDFGSFAPWLERLLDLKRQRALAIDQEKDAYEVMFEDYEPDLTLQEASGLLTTIREGIRPLVESISRLEQPDSAFLGREVPLDVQERFTREIAAYIGYDFNRGRLDTSAHPMTIDGRITTRYSSGWLDAIKATLHECGHGMHRHALPFELYGEPIGSSPSSSIGESQSRLWENHVGSSQAFWQGCFPRLKEAYRPILDDISAGQFVRAINRVEPGLIRTEADELTYNMHIILRFELEQELVSGNLGVRDLPDAWNAKMGELLGITPPNDTLGVLQDIHWSMGYFGYFPTYTLGSMMAAQQFSAAKLAVPDLEERIAAGEFGALHCWLRGNVQAHGQRYRAQELMERATGKAPRPEDYISYLTEKYSGLYNL